MQMGDYRSLAVWQCSHAFALSIYQATRTFPAAERFALGDQVRRAAVSIPANLAEGCGRDSDREIARYARIALGSASELEYYLYLARDLGYIPPLDLILLSSEVGKIKRMLAKLATVLTRSARTVAVRRSPNIVGRKTDD